MNKSHFKFHSIGLRPAAVRIFRLAALALTVVLLIPVATAESRAIKTRVAPVYPEMAKRMRIAGEVRLEVTVDPEGKVTDVKKVSGNTMLSSAAEDAVRKWRFDSGPGTSTVEVTLNFAVGQ